MDQPSETPAPRAPAPLPTAPVSADELRASDADRERVAHVLRTAFEEGRLTIEEHSERIETLYAAKTMGELAPLTFDLPSDGRLDLTKAPPAPRPSSAPHRPARKPDDPVETPVLVAVFGGAEKRGPGRIGERMKAVAVFGGIEIDLSDATFDEPVLVIHAVSVFGGIEVRVPEGVTLRGHGAGIFGGFGVGQQIAEDPDAPTVIVKGAAVFGGVEVRPKKWKGLRGRHDDWRRRHHHRHHHRHLRDGYREDYRDDRDDYRDEPDDYRGDTKK